MKKPDSELVDLSLRGERTAFRLIVENTQGMVYQVAYRFLRDQHEAEDAVQEIFLRLWNNLSQFREGSKLSTWLYRITSNYCLDKLKSRSYRASKNSVSAEKLEISGSLPADLPLALFEANELVAQAAEKLTPIQKAVFILRDLEGLSSSEVCESLDMNTDSVKSNLYHARKRMSELLKPYLKEIL